MMNKNFRTVLFALVAMFLGLTAMAQQAADALSLNLDDGVRVNYNKFGKAIKEVSGLNDKIIKNKVRDFDWIDTTKIK
jgi:hypothetical protein